MNEKELMNEMAARGCKAPAVTIEMVDDAIVSEAYYLFPGTTVTVCLLTLRNGFSVVGQSACASPENFRPEIGGKLAYQDARGKIWTLEGYLLKEKLYREKIA
jgi:Phage protein (N4 Gp49/phage Sf6 gene 66) family